MNLTYKKILGQCTKVLGIEKTPNDPVFFLESVPNAGDDGESPVWPGL